MMKKNILIIIMIIMMASFVSAATYYTSPTGSDVTGDGSDGNPWGTISCHFGRILCDGGGSDEISTGDTLILKDGHYNETLNALGSIYLDTGVRFTTITAENPGMVLVECPSCTNFIFYIDSIVTINGINFTQSIRDQPRYSSGDDYFNTLTNLNFKDDGEIQLSNDRDTDILKHSHYLENITFTNATAPIKFTGNVSNALINNITVDGLHLYRPVSCSGSTGGNEGSIGDNITIQNSNIFLKGSMLDIKSSDFTYATNCDEGAGTINFINNSFSGRISIESNYETVKLLNNYDMSLGYSLYGDYDGMEWGNINYQNGDFTISDYMDTNYGYASFIDLIFTSNLVLTNITLGARNDKINNDSVAGEDYMIFNVNSITENVTIKNSDIHAKDYRTMFSSTTYVVTNFLFTNNTVSMRGPANGPYLRFANYSTFSDNYIYADNYTNDIGYAIGMGYEASTIKSYYNTLDNNVVVLTSNTTDNNWHIHGTFMGSNDHATYKNNHVTGGAYGLVFKANSNGLLTNNTFIGATYSLTSLMVKGGENITASHNTITTAANQLSAYSLTTSTNIAGHFTYSKNITFTENTVTNNLTDRIFYVYTNYLNTQDSTYYLYNNDVVDDATDIKVVISAPNENVSLWSYQNITVNAEDDTTTTLKNASGATVYTTLGSFEKQLLSITYLDDTLSNFSEFTVYGEYEEREESEVVILNNDKAVTFSFDNALIETEDGIINVKETSYIAFGLIAVMLLASIAMTFFVMMKDGADTGTLMTLGILAIGVSVILIVGFIIMNSVAIGIIAGI
jgi:hypothetical protein